jgi:hypothetical protein
MALAKMLFTIGLNDQAVTTEYPGASYQALSRGDRREAIFRNDADRKLLKLI